GPAADDRARDAPRVRLLAVLENDARELRLGEPIRERGRARVGRRVQAHVEGFVLLEGESPSRLLELPGGHAEVQEDRAGALDPARAGGPLEVAEARAHEPDALAERRQPRTRPRERLGVDVQTEEAHR